MLLLLISVILFMVSLSGVEAWWIDYEKYDDLFHRYEWRFLSILFFMLYLAFVSFKNSIKSKDE